jgi:hypothetical protein
VDAAKEWRENYPEFKRKVARYNLGHVCGCHCQGDQIKIALSVAQAGFLSN